MQSADRYKLLLFSHQNVALLSLTELVEKIFAANAWSSASRCKPMQAYAPRFCNWARAPRQTRLLSRKDQKTRRKIPWFRTSKTC